MEIDRVDFALGTPPHAIVLGCSTRHTDVYLMTPEDLLDPTPDMSGTQSDSVRSDMVYFCNDKGGAVFSVGSIAWAGAMAWNNYRNEVSQLTWNVLKHFQSRQKDAGADTTPPSAG
jgi:N,N-dimethylformamidase